MDNLYYLFIYLLLFFIGYSIFCRIQIFYYEKIRKSSNEIIEWQKNEIERLKKELESVI